MPLRIVRFLALLLVALTLGLLWAHVLELPGKLRLDGPAWLAVQQNLYIAFGPPVGAPVELAAIAATATLAFLVRRTGAFRATLAAALLAGAGLAVWFWLVAPMNAQLSAWTPETLPPAWTAVRDRWELGHAIHAALFGAAFCCLIWARFPDT